MSVLIIELPGATNFTEQDIGNSQATTPTKNARSHWPSDCNSAFGTHFVEI
jgi:hypothetical protein